MPRGGPRGTGMACARASLPLVTLLLPSGPSNLYRLLQIAPQAPSLWTVELGSNIRKNRADACGLAPGGPEGSASLSPLQGPAVPAPRLVVS